MAEVGTIGERRMKVEAVYATIVAVILIFPWSLVALTLAGALMERRRVRVRLRATREP